LSYNFRPKNEAIMSTLTVNAKGQVILPNNLLKHLGVRPGEKIAVAKLPGGRLVVSARPMGKISDAFGLLKKKDGPSLSIEDINRIAADGWAGKR
jgi:bifunctional DNA-binding transcriptional regulator/antitoxin component of YhaV-PrlF toxin-antitoxin module